METDSSHSRTGTGKGKLTADFGDKVPEDQPFDEPFFERRWVRVLAFCLVCLAGLAGVGALAYFNHWRDSQVAEIARQRSCLQTFLKSPEFERFVRTMDAQLVATINYIAARPQDVHALLPEVAARDKSRREVPWTHQVMPVPISTSQDSAAVVRAGRQVNALLAQRGHVVDDAVRRSARQIFLRTLVPFAQQFIQRAPGNAFHALFLDRSMQEDALAAFAALHGPTASVADTERLFALYAVVGPSMWQAIEQERAAQAKRASVTP